MEGGSVVSTMLTTTAQSMQAELVAVLPIAGGLFAVVAGVFMGVKMFKRITGAKS